FAQTIPSPKEHFGFNIGDDYQLANYTQTEAYFKKIAEASDRTRLVDIGVTEEGRHQYMLIVSSPGNIKNLDHYKEISQKLAHAENVTEEQAHALANEGKAIVWIDGGLHATEVVGAHQLIETIYQFVSRKDPETLRILDQSIILFTHANPDGQELVSNWYMRESDPGKRKMNIPRLYQKYIGHDNNRDFFMMNMKETQNISRQQYVEWMPQIIYNHHQAGPQGSVVAGPPYRDPFNYAYDPILITSLDGVGAAMNNRLNVEGKPGYTQRAGSVYSTWWNGGLRTTGYFHNMIGLLTEIIGSPTPAKVPLVPNRLIPNGATPYPVVPQEWHFRQSIDYSVSLNYAVLNYAVNQRQELLFGIYRMGRNSIEKGSRDNWTLTPKYVDSINKAYRKDRAATRPADSGRSISASDTIPLKFYNVVFKDSTLRDARGYIISSDQPDFATAVRFVNALVRSGILVHKATNDFSAAGKKYPAGSYIIKTNQAFRPHVLDMFEPQDHPNDFQYPGGPPVPPYDAAGWTLAYEMGVQFDRVLNGFEGPFQRVEYGEIQSPKGRLDASSSVAGYMLNSASNNSFIAVNDLLKEGLKVFRVPLKTGNDNPGTFYIPASSKARLLLAKYASDLNISIGGVKKTPSGLTPVSPLRIALWDVYGGSMSSGWVRWILEQYHFPFQVIYSKEIDTTDLRKKYDAIVFVSGAIPAVNRGTSNRSVNTQPKPEEIPVEYRASLGRISTDTSIQQLKRFMELGGSVITIGSSTNLAYHIGLPVRNALVEMNNGQERPLAGEKFYIPGSIMRLSVDTTRPATWGMPSVTDVYFDASPVFKIAPSAIAKGEVKPLAWFATDKPLRSGWAWGQAYLQDGVAAFEAPVGSGKLYAFGPEITFRAQTHGTFKLLFNQLYRMGNNAY
ncbi:MAG: M14 metallopeptidase family protein, partial [Segetibacter sp.]